MIIAIDQSLSCSGVTVWDRGELVHFTCIKTPPKEEAILRIRQMVKEVDALVKAYNVFAIVIESLPYGSVSTSVRALAGLHMCIQNYCLDNNIEFVEQNVSSIKRTFTGKGNASKTEMMQAMEEHYPITFEEFKSKNYKKTTGLADLVDSFAIYKSYVKTR